MTLVGDVAIGKIGKCAKLSESTKEPQWDSGSIYRQEKVLVRACREKKTRTEGGTI